MLLFASAFIYLLFVYSVWRAHSILPRCARRAGTRALLHGRHFTTSCWVFDDDTGGSRAAQWRIFSRATTISRWKIVRCRYAAALTFQASRALSPLRVLPADWAAVQCANNKFAFSNAIPAKISFSLRFPFLDSCMSFSLYTFSLKLLRGTMLPLFILSFATPLAHCSHLWFLTSHLSLSHHLIISSIQFSFSFGEGGREGGRTGFPTGEVAFGSSDIGMCISLS